MAAQSRLLNGPVVAAYVRPTSVKSVGLPIKPRWGHLPTGLEQNTFGRRRLRWKQNCEPGIQQQHVQSCYRVSQRPARPHKPRKQRSVCWSREVVKEEDSKAKEEEWRVSSILRLAGRGCVLGAATLAILCLTGREALAVELGEVLPSDGSAVFQSLLGDKEVGSDGGSIEQLLADTTGEVVTLEDPVDFRQTTEDSLAPTAVDALLISAPMGLGLSAPEVKAATMASSALLPAMSTAAAVSTPAVLSMNLVSAGPGVLSSASLTTLTPGVVAPPATLAACSLPSLASTASATSLLGSAAAGDAVAFAASASATATATGTAAALQLASVGTAAAESVALVHSSVAATPVVTSALASAVHHFLGGGVAGAAGAVAVAPLDTVKTRMQAQRRRSTGDFEYKDPLDCLQKVIKDEGPGALYAGLIPQLVGVAPEKAVKLTVNDMLLSMLEGYVPGARVWALELLAGGGGGLCQVIFTNPMEIVKIRLQTQGQAVGKGAKPKSAWDVVKELGFTGLYQGSTATLLREIPASAIFFCCYALLRQVYPDSSFVAGCLAAAPSAFLCTPMDVIKTRLQVEERPGEKRYNGAWDCLQKILQEEGPLALFQGGLTRVLRVSPQFGVTLMIYELLN